MSNVTHADCLVFLATIPDSSVDSCVTDPPYELGFMGKAWDKTGIANNVEMWAEVLRVLKPGAHLLAFAATRTYHRMVCAIEDAGFEIRDQIGWLYGSGFPKSLDVSKAIDKAAGAEREVVGVSSVTGARAGSSFNDGCKGTKRTFQNIAPVVNHTTAPATAGAKQWDGWGTALKPAWEPIVLARKPLSGTVAANVLQHGCGALNIDGCRIEGIVTSNSLVRNVKGFQSDGLVQGETGSGRESIGRWPANIILSYPEDEYMLRSDVTAEQKRELFKWMQENT